MITRKEVHPMWALGLNLLKFKLLVFWKETERDWFLWQTIAPKTIILFSTVMFQNYFIGARFLSVWRLNSLHKNTDIYAQMDIYLLLTYRKDNKSYDLQTKSLIFCK